MTRILWLSAEVPDRRLGGGSIRQSYLLEAVARRAETTLVLAGRLTNAPVRDAVKHLIEVPGPVPERDPPSSALRRARDLWRALGPRVPVEVQQTAPLVRRVRAAMPDPAGFDVVCVEHTGMAPVVAAAHRNHWVLTMHQLLTRRDLQAIPVAAGRRQAWLLRRDLAKARAFEQWALDAYDTVVVSSDADAEGLGGRAVVVPNGADTDRIQPSPLPPSPTMVLTGSLNWGPNVEGARWFCAEVLPLVRAAIPDATIAIVGRQPTAEARALAGLEGVSVHPDVESVEPFLSAARVAVVPIRVGSGTRLKALEAMAAGRVVVGTSIGLEGIDATPGVDAYIADAADE
ncbi:MAG: polysaccharide biosynthesis protein PslH, partial [Chloroflexota bacterium]|nr:polysaccharide biosynthesis protein PslH [Chloroflexota bacterium]